MTQNFKQFVFCKNGSAKNSPSNLTGANLVAGNIFLDYQPISQIGIQAPPGTKIYFNNNDSPIIIGYTGLLELDFSSTGGSISSIAVDQASIDYISSNDSAILIIDIAYFVGEV